MFKKNSNLVFHALRAVKSHKKKKKNLDCGCRNSCMKGLHYSNETIFDIWPQVDFYSSFPTLLFSRQDWVTNTKERISMFINDKKKKHDKGELLHHLSEVLDGFLHFLQFCFILPQLEREKKQTDFSLRQEPVENCNLRPFSQTNCFPSILLTFSASASCTLTGTFSL